MEGEDKIKQGLAHCNHHDTHWEYCYNLDERIAYINGHKPEEEQPLRLSLFFIVPDRQLPGKDSKELERLVKAKVAYRKAWDIYLNAKDTYLKATKDAGLKATREGTLKEWEAALRADTAYYNVWRDSLKTWVASLKKESAYDKAMNAYRKKYSKELEELHDKLCPDCPWSDDEKTIFTRKDEEGNWY